MIEQLLTKSKYRRELMMFGPLLLACFAGYLLVVGPGLKNLERIKNEINSLAGKETSYRYIVDNEKKLADYRQALEKTGDKAWLIEQINQIAQKAGLSILSVAPEDPQKVGDFVDRTTVRIEADGNFHQLATFVAATESLEGFVRVSNLDLSSGLTLDSAPQEGAPTGSRSAYKITLSVDLFSAAKGAI